MTAYQRSIHVAAILIAATFCASIDTATAADPKAADAAPLEPAEQYRLAAEHFTESRWEQAAAGFRKLIDEADDAAATTLVEQSRFYLGESLVRAGRSADAIDALRTFTAKSEDETLLPIARYRLGEACYLAGKNDEAQDVLNGLVDDATASGLWPSTTPRVLYYLGDLAARSGDHTAAADWFGHATAAYPEDELYESAALGRIEALLKLQDHATAWAAARAWSGTVEAPAHAELLAAQALEGLARQADAAAAYDRYLAKAPADDEDRDIALYESAWNLRKLDRPADAAKRFDELVGSQPNSRFRADAAYRSAEYYHGTGHTDEATARLREARGAADGELLPHVLALELQVAMAAGDRPAAEAAVEALTQKYPQHEVAKNAAYWKGEIAYRAEAWDDATEHFALAMASTADKQSAWYAGAISRRIESLAQAGRWAETIAAVEQSRTLLPAAAPRFELEYLGGRAHAARAEFREAREAYGRVVADEKARGTETAVLAQFMTAESYFHQRDYTVAAGEYAKVVAQAEFAEWRAAALLQAGKCQEHLGKHAEAKAHYERLIADFAGSPYAEDAARRRDAALRQAEAPAGPVQRK